MNIEQTQREKFEQAARELECDDDETRFKDRMKKLARHRPDDKKK